jgi:hypothetical protein
MKGFICIVRQKSETLLKAWYYGRLYKLNLFTDKELKMMEKIKFKKTQRERKRM